MSLQEVWKAKRALRVEYAQLAYWAHADWGKCRKDMKAETITFWLEGLGKKVEALSMAAKAVKKNVPGKTEWKGFVNYVLSVDDKVRFGKWDIDDKDLFSLVAGDVSSGYKISVSFNSQNDTFVASYMCNADGDPNQGYMLSAFAPDWYYAVRSLCFKHNVVLEGVWPIGKAAEKDSWG